MNTIKNLVVVATLFGVGYGTHVVLNKPIASEDPQRAEPEELSDSFVEFDQAAALRPHVSFDTTEDAAPADEQPIQEMPGSVAISQLPPPMATQQDIAPANYDVSEGQTAANLLPQDPLPPVESNRSPHTFSDQPVRAQPESLQRGAATSPPEPNHETAPTGDGALEAVWQLAQSKLERDELADALLMLSDWYRDANPTDDRRHELLPLLDQLAGSVIYSRHHLLEPAYTAEEGETLEQIARLYNVPANLLAKINGISSSDGLTAGQTLKVVRGPFLAETNLTHRELTLYLGDFYAGRFQVRLGKDVPIQNALLEVVEKLEDRPYFDSTTKNEIGAGDPNNPYGQTWIGLRDTSGRAVSSYLGIHGVGQTCSSDDPRGCIGLSPRDAEDLYSILSIGSRVRITR